MHTFIKIIILAALLTAAFQSKAAQEQVIFAVDMIRHGDRTPVSDIPNAVYHWPRGLGMLTKRGEKQEYQLGQLLRRRYVKNFGLLSAGCDPTVIAVFSTDMSRTIESARALLQGMVPHCQIAINVFKDKHSNFLITQPKHGFFSAIKLYIRKQYHWAQQTRQLQPLLQQLSEQSGMQLQSFSNLAKFSDNLYVRLQHRIPLPAWIDQADAIKLIQLIDQTIIYYFKQPEVVATSGKLLLSTLNSYFNNKINHKTQLKYVLLSGHDSSLMTALTVLGVPAQHLPPYASDLNFLLLKTATGYVVRVSYNNKPLFIPACHAMQCSLDQFAGLSQ